MDLGAVLCRPRAPRCDECPVRGRCTWRGRQDLPDPADGSSGVSRRQARFDGSDRQARGRLMKALGSGPVQGVDLPRVMGRDPATAHRLVAALADEGLCRLDGDSCRLP